MYICVCKAVTERQLDQAVHGGATSLRHLRETLGVTSECGRCARCALECMRATMAKNATVAHTGLLAQAA